MPQTRERRTTVRRALLLTLSLLLVVGASHPSVGAPPTTGNVKKVAKKVAKKQIKKLVPGMIDKATIDQDIIPTVTASVTDPNKTLFTEGPFTASLDCSDDGGSVNLKLLIRTSEENSVANASYLTGDLDPAEGDQRFQEYTGNAPGGEAFSWYPYYDSIFLRSPSGTHMYVQFDSVTNFKGSHCRVGGWFLDLTGKAPSSGARLHGTTRPGLNAPLTTGRVKNVATKVAKKQIKKMVPGMIDKATIDQGVLPSVTASTTDPNKTIFSRGPFTVSLDCSLDGGNAELTLLARTTEENSVVNDAGDQVGDLDPSEGDQVVRSYDGNPPGGGADIGDLFDEHASFRSPSGTHFEVQFDTVTNFQGNHCYVDGWFVDLAGKAPGSGSGARLDHGTTQPGLSAPLTTGRVKKLATKVVKKQIKKMVPGMIDKATFDQGTILPVSATTSDPNKTLFARGPFTISVDCSLDGGDVNARLLARTTEENSVVNSGWGFTEEVDPIDGDIEFSEGADNPPGGEAGTGSGLGYQVAVFQSPGGTHLYGQFDALTNYQGNHCFVDGWFLDVAG